jgi:type II secretory pathway component PulM
VVAGRLLRGLAARPYRALVTIVALGLLVVAFSWPVLDVRDTSTARAAANGQLARKATTLRRQRARIKALSAEMRQLAQGAPSATTSTAPPSKPDVPHQPAARNPPTVRPHDRHR